MKLGNSPDNVQSTQQIHAIMEQIKDRLAR